MKSKFSLIIIVVAAIVTLSFSFASVEDKPGVNKGLQVRQQGSEPVGGFVIDEAY